MKEFELKRLRPYIAAAVVAVVVAVYGSVFAPSTLVEPITRICIFLLLALSTNILMGYLGMMPLGQAVFIGISSYTYVIFVVKLGYSMGVSIAIAILLSMICSVIIGFFCLRGGVGFAVGFLYLGFNSLLQMICVKTQYVGFENGMSGAKRFAMFDEPRSFLIFVVIVVGICYMLIYRMMHSPASKVIQGIRENQERVTYLGVNVFLYKLLVFCISAFFMSIGGILYAMYLRGAYPNMWSNNAGLQIMMMCMIGGMAYFYGPVIGAVIGTVLFSKLSTYTNYWQGTIGFILIIIVLFFKGGILGFYYQSIKGRLHKKKTAVASKEKDG